LAGPLRADTVGKRRRHHRHLRPEIACVVHAAHQTARLFDAVAVKAQRGLIEAATAHGLDEIGRPEVMRLALRAPRHLRAQAQGHAGDDRCPQTAAPSASPGGGRSVAGSLSQGRAVHRVKDALDQIVSQVTEEVERFDHCFRILPLQRDEWIFDYLVIWRMLSVQY
jgi:hypothetical protein